MNERCTVRQLGTVLFVGLLAPASTLPAQLAHCGAWSFLSPLVLLLPAGLVLWRVGKLGRDGLASRWKGPGGTALALLYYIWATGLCALTAGGCVHRLSRTDYLQTPPWLLALALTAVSAYLVRKGAGSFFRASEIFFLALLATLVLPLALGATYLEPENLRRQTPAEWQGIFTGVLPAAAALSVGTLTAFFPRLPRLEGESRMWRWLALWCGVAAGLCLLVLGTLGPGLAARTPLPFFLALQGLGFPGGFQRLEALCTAAWVLSDLTLLGLAALAAERIAGGRRWTRWPPLLCGFLGGCFLPNDLVGKAAPVLLGVNLALGAVIPTVISLVLPPPEEGRGGISCG